jgi:hypothetical protein
MLKEECCTAKYEGRTFYRKVLRKKGRCKQCVYAFYEKKYIYICMYGWKQRRKAKEGRKEGRKEEGTIDGKRERWMEAK